MRVAVLLMLACVGLAGCTYDDDPSSDFKRTCPSWFPSPSTPQWSSPQGAMRHDADSQNPDVQDPNDRSKWIPIPGHVGSVTEYHGGILAYVELEFVNVSVVDSLLVFEAYRASDAEPVTTPPEDDQPIPPTGARLQFSTQPLRGGIVSSEVRFGPHVGHDNRLTGLEAHVYIDLQPNPSSANPSRVRIDAVFTGNQDDDDTTYSVALFDLVKATFWYLHEDCIA